MPGVEPLLFVQSQLRLHVQIHACAYYTFSIHPVPLRVVPPPVFLPTRPFVGLHNAAPTLSALILR